MDFSDTPQPDANDNPVADYDHTLLPGDFAANDRMFEHHKYAPASYAWVYSMDTPSHHGDYTWEQNFNPDHPAPALTITLEYQTPGMWVLNARATIGPDNPKKFSSLGQQYHYIYEHTPDGFKQACEHIKTIAETATRKSLPLTPDQQAIAALNTTDNNTTDAVNPDNYPDE